MRQHPHRGFTLIELLVVISIVAVLASMLLPAIGMVRATARQSACQSNMRQLGLCLQNYADDWDGTYMSPYSGPSMTWGKTLTEYTEDTTTLSGQTTNLGPWRCPENRVQLFRSNEGLNDERGQSYGANGYRTYADPLLLTEKRFFSRPVGTIRHPSELAAIFEADCYRLEDSYTDGLNSTGKDLSALPDKGTRLVRYPHAGRTNVLYADQHIGSLSVLLSNGTFLGAKPTKSASFSNGRFWYSD